MTVVMFKVIPFGFKGIIIFIFYFPASASPGLGSYQEMLSGTEVI